MHDEIGRYLEGQSGCRVRLDFREIENILGFDLPASARALGPAVTAMTNSPDALPALLPVGLGNKAGQFNQIYIDTFERIALNNEDIKSVLDNQAQTLRQLMVDAKAPCWLPDADSAGNPCPVH